MAQNTAIPKGTRDFLPQDVLKRQYIYDTIKEVFKRYNFQPIETPSFELSTTLMGKYGEEGDRLIFRILNSGEKLKKADVEALNNENLPRFANSISEKSLRYDLTVPFARFVVQHQNEIRFPFKRYQIQPVWRADRPQHGRYQEFYQCDADVVGSDSLHYEVDFVQIIDEIFCKLGLPAFTILVNNRKILSGIAEVTQQQEHLIDITVAIDKLDKIGQEKVLEELTDKGIPPVALESLKPLFALSLSADNQTAIDKMKEYLAGSTTGLQGIEELEFVLAETQKLGLERGKLKFDVTLARGLNYYTGAIFEVKADHVKMGSICGGGRYDDLTALFGMKNLSGVGISFGADRIFDVMNELDLYPKNLLTGIPLLFINFGDEEVSICRKLAKHLRQNGVPCDIYPSATKIQKQMKYANDIQAQFVALIGKEELENEQILLKDMTTGEQVTVLNADLVQLMAKTFKN